MKCPRCQHIETKVIESREIGGGESTRRRRACLDCQYRFTTYERIERPNLTVIKKDGTRQAYDRAKLVSGLQKACEKTTMSAAQFEDLTAGIEQKIYDLNEPDINSTQIGAIVMEALAQMNQVAYVRFASVYRNFSDVQSFEREVSNVRQLRQGDEPRQEGSSKKGTV